MPIDVMHIITRLDWGGSAQNTLLTALGQAGSRFRPTVVLGSIEGASGHGGEPAVGENVARLEKAGVRCIQIDALTRSIHPIRDLRALVALVRLLRRERPAIVHTHTSKGGVLGRLAARLAGVRVIVHTPHGHVFYGHFGPIASRLFLWLERRLAGITTRFIALTAAERDDHLRFGVGSASRFAVVASGVDLARFRQVPSLPRRPESVDCPPDAVVIGSVGWLTTVKGHHVLIDAMARIRTAQPRAHLILIGTGERLANLAQRAAQLGLADRVHFLGHRTDIANCLAAMDLFVLPSLNEGMGRALVEAMAAARPVIASRTGGVPALVRHGETGLLVPPGDSVAVAEAIQALLAEPHHAKTLATAAADSLGDAYGIETMVRQINAVYDDALAAGR